MYIQYIIYTLNEMYLTREATCGPMGERARTDWSDRTIDKVYIDGPQEGSLRETVICSILRNIY